MRRHMMLVAIDVNGGFAKDKQIPWDMHEGDMQFFRNITNDNIVVMGKNTYLEIAEMRKGKVKEDEHILPGRTCFVISSTLNEVNGAILIPNYNALYTHKDADPNKIIFTIGGERLYRENIHLVDRVATTIFNKEHDCDQFFPVKELTKCFDVTDVIKLDETTAIVEWSRKR